MYPFDRYISYLQNMPQNEMHPRCDMPTVLPKSRIVYLPLISIMLGIYLPVIVKGWSDFAAFLTDF